MSDTAAVSIATTDKNCQINIWNQHGWTLDPVMLLAVMAKMMIYVDIASRIEVYPQERVPDDAPAYRHPGSIEWIINIYYRTGGQITLGAFQRSVVEHVSFNS